MLVSYFSHRTIRSTLLYKVAVVMILLIPSSSLYADSDHSLFDGILKQHVKNGVVDYPAIQRDPAFEQYIEELSRPLTTVDQKEQLAFWINAYNAFAIKGILDERSPSTFFGRIGYFKTAKYIIGGKERNLYDLERKVIIPFGEPRIHFAINCASVSCPKLISEAYFADKLDAQLDQVTHYFLADTTRNQFDRENNIVYLSKIFDWFKKDFKQHSGSVQQYVAQYVNDAQLSEALNNEQYRIKHLPYDWSLNGIAPN